MYDIPGPFDYENGEEDEYKPPTIKQILNSPKRKRGMQSTAIAAPSTRVVGTSFGIQAGGLMPPEYYRNPSVSGSSSQMIDEEKFKDPLSKKTKLRLLQTYQDYTVSSAIGVLIHYVLGQTMKATVYPVSRDQLKSQQEVEERLNEVIKEFDLGPKSLEDFQNFIDMVDLNCELYERHLPQAMAQSYVFGRAALWIVRANKDIESQELPVKWGFREGVPVALRPLDSMNLGDVIVDRKSWEPKTLMYDGTLGSENEINRKNNQGQRKSTEELDIEDIVYFTRDDYNIIPDSLNYGFSRLVDAIPISENKRRLTKKVLSEINNNQWAGLNIYEIPGMSTKDLQNFANTLKPGKNKVTNQPITVHNVNPQFDMQGNLEQLRELHLNILMAITVPSVLLNFENITNRATTEAVLSAWQQTKLEAERNWIRNILWKYWYRPLIEFYFPDKDFLYLRIKIIEEFQSIEFSSFFEKQLAATNLYASRIINLREARELINKPPFPVGEDGEAEDLETQDMIDKLVMGNPDIVMPPQQQEPNQPQGATGREQEEKRQKEKPAAANTPKQKTLLNPQSKVRNVESILSRIRNPPSGKGRAKR